jgi:uncharacterized membrane protein
MTKLDLVFRALHVWGTFMWIGGLFGVTAFVAAAAAEPDPAARGRLTKFVRQAAIIPDIGAAIAIVFGAHWLFKFDYYKVAYMHPKLTLVAALIGLHVYLRRKVGVLKRTGEVKAPPGFLRPVLSLIAIGILILVMVKVPS